MNGMSSFFDPRSVALVGSTDREGAAGRITLENLLLAHDKRKIYPINPNRDSVLNLKCYPNIRSLPEVPDLTVIVTPANTVVDIVDECGQAGVKALIIVSSGFNEIGGEGLDRHEKIIELSNQYQLKIMGPNCMRYQTKCQS